MNGDMQEDCIKNEYHHKKLRGKKAERDSFDMVILWKKLEVASMRDLFGYGLNFEHLKSIGS